MKLLTYAWNGRPKLGALLDGRVVDLARTDAAIRRHAGHGPGSFVADHRLSHDCLAFLSGGEESMAAARRALNFIEERLESEEARGLCHPVANVDFLPPVPRPGKVICVGLNYRSHLAEIGEPLPEYPIVFLKAVTSLIGHRQSIVLPRVSREIDYEGELAVVIGRRAKYVRESEALSHVAGYTCANDVSAHDIEFRTSQWTSGKMLDAFCPLGPLLVTRDRVPAPDSLRLRTTLNGKTVQDACSSDMVFSVPYLISYLSSLATLEPGDVILTGTPAGIGCNQKPQVFLQAGDSISVQIDGIGTLTNRVVAEEEQ